MSREERTLGSGWSVRVERIPSGEARLSRFCDHGWIEGTGHAPLCRRKATKRTTLRDSEGRLVDSLECCDLPGCLRRDLDAHFREAQAATAPPREARAEEPIRDIFDDLDDGLVGGEEEDRIFAMLDAHDREGGHND